VEYLISLLLLVGVAMPWSKPASQATKHVIQTDQDPGQGSPPPVCQPGTKCPD
jgi:hypothetical protein